MDERLQQEEMDDASDATATGSDAAAICLPVSLTHGP